MPTIILHADSTSLILNGVPYPDFAAGDFLELSMPNALTSRVNAANGGVNVGQRVDANIGVLTFRVQKYSSSDINLNNARNQASPVIFNGSIKEDFSRDGTNTVESIVLENGTITTQPTNTKNNTDGNGLMEYMIEFRNVVRNL